MRTQIQLITEWSQLKSFREMVFFFSDLTDEECIMLELAYENGMIEEKPYEQ